MRDVFISYRREGGSEIAQAVRAELERHGIGVFLDVDDLGSHYFDDRLLTEIRNSPNFILILSPGCLDACADENDWLRREISHAIRHRRNIIPLFCEGFEFPPESNLPPDIAELPRYNAIHWSHTYYDAMIERLLAYVAKPGRISGLTARRRSRWWKTRWLLPAIVFLALSMLAAIIGLALNAPHQPSASGADSSTSEPEPDVTGSGIQQSTVGGEIPSEPWPSLLDLPDPALAHVEYAGIQSSWSWGGSDDDSVEDLALDGDGNIYLVGAFNKTADLNPSVDADSRTSQGSTDAYVIKLSSFGEFQWAKTWGGRGRDSATGIVADGSASICVTGHFQGDADLNPGPETDMHPEWSGSYVLKLDLDGNYQWARSWGNREDFTPRPVKAAIDSAGDMYIIGHFAQAIDLDPGPNDDTHVPSGGGDPFLVKLDSAGEFQWARTWGGEAWDAANDVAVDSFGNALVAGSFTESADLDPGPQTDIRSSAGDQDAFLIEITPSGNYQWGKSWGGTGWTSACALSVDKSGNTYVLGHFAGTADFDPGAADHFINSVGDSDVFLMKFDESDMVQWAASWGGPGADTAGAVCTDSSGDVYAVGSFTLNADFCPGKGEYMVESTGGPDSFVVRLDSTGAFMGARTWGGSGNDAVLCIAASSSGDLCIGGWFEGDADLDPGVGSLKFTSEGKRDPFLVMVDRFGSLAQGTSLISYTLPPGMDQF